MRKNSSKNIILPPTVLVLAGRGKGKVRSQLMLMLTIAVKKLNTSWVHAVIAELND
jgi:hypothetical protein